MSQAEGSIGSTGSPAAPPPSAPAAAPPTAPPPPAAATSTPVDPAVAGPESASSDVVATIPGALPSEGTKPATLDENRARFRRQLAGEEPVEGVQPAEALPAEAQPTEPAVTETPVEAQPAEEAEPVVEPAETAPEAPVEAEGEDTDYRERAFTAEEVEARFDRKLSKKERAEIGQWEAHRGELIEQKNKIGGDLGIQLASVLNPIILGKENPTDEDVDAIFDQIVLPENAGAGQLFDLMGKRLVNTQLQEETCGSCQSDGNVANPKCNDHIPMGKEFASGMISEEYGKNEDGTSFDFFGMKPIELVDFLMRAAKAKDEDGEPILQMEFLKQELEGKGKPAPTERELALQKQVEELSAGQQSKEAEQTREREQLNVQYQTQARGAVSRYIMNAVTPLAAKANWALAEGEAADSPQAQEKKELGELIADHINMKLIGTAGSTAPDYTDIQAMIDNRTAFDSVTGQPTPRFRLKLDTLQTKAKALFNRKQSALQGRFKFSASTSRNAQLVDKNGATKPAAQAQPAAIPPLAVPAPTPTDRPLTTEERLAENRRKFRETSRNAQQQPGVLQ